MIGWVYILRGSNGRHYIGSTADLTRRMAEYKRGYTYTTKRLGESVDLVASKEFETLERAREVERSLKAKKNPRLVLYHLQQG
jgi:predicted GIY-YIG superfamily endonuclease